MMPRIRLATRRKAQSGFNIQLVIAHRAELEEMWETEKYTKLPPLE